MPLSNLVGSPSSKTSSIVTNTSALVLCLTFPYPSLYVGVAIPTWQFTKLWYKCPKTVWNEGRFYSGIRSLRPVTAWDSSGAPEGIRTPNPRFRSCAFVFSDHVSKGLTINDERLNHRVQTLHIIYWEIEITPGIIIDELSNGGTNGGTEFHSNSVTHQQVILGNWLW